MHQAGYEPRGLVTGTCIFRPYAFGSWAPMSQSTELTAMSGAMHEARTIAMRRLRAQAGRVDARRSGRCATLGRVERPRVPLHRCRHGHLAAGPIITAREPQ